MSIHVKILDTVTNAMFPTIVANFDQFGKMTALELYKCLEYIFITPKTADFRLCKGSVILDPESAAIVPVGNYIVCTNDSAHQPKAVKLTAETARSRSMVGTPTWPQPFNFRWKTLVRDGACVISGYSPAAIGYVGLDAAHIIPRNHFAFWNSQSQATMRASLNPMEADGIDSHQNGIFLQATLHRLWDALYLAIHPATMNVIYFADDNGTRALYDHKLVHFNQGYSVFPPTKEILEVHFQQCVLARMKGAGQPAELDPSFDPSADARILRDLTLAFGKDWQKAILDGKPLLPVGAPAVQVGGH